jgi:hypothetical protein
MAWHGMAWHGMAWHQEARGSNPLGPPAKTCSFLIAWEFELVTELGSGL